METGIPNKPLCRTLVPETVPPCYLRRFSLLSIKKDRRIIANHSQSRHCQNRLMNHIKPRFELNSITPFCHHHPKHYEDLPNLPASVHTILIKPWNGSGTRGNVITQELKLPCAFGKKGLTSFKQEGDSATPIISTRALFGFYRKDRETKPRSRLPFYPLKATMGWCDDPQHRSYNRLIALPFAHSHEVMWRKDALYDLVIVLDINVQIRQKGKGSALFMHVAREGYPPTEGCIALNKRDLRRLLCVITPTTRITITR